MRFFARHADSIESGLDPKRLPSLDVMRGITITAMILVNNPGSWRYVYAPLAHAEWHGWTPTDLIFPFFIFIVGISLQLVVTRDLARGITRGEFIRRAIVRTAKLFALGLFLALFYFDVFDPAFNWLDDRLLQLRVMGVLQRIGLVYLATVLIVICCRTTGRAVVATTLLLAYWVALAFVPYTDSAGTVYRGELVFGNSLAAWLDNLVLGAAHVYYDEATPFAFDPEGLLSTLPAIATCLSGVLAGELLIRRGLDTAARARVLAAAGTACLLAGQAWSLWLPINKALWTSSYVLLTSGLAMLCLAALIWLIDIRGTRRWGMPFVVFGANAIFFFVFSGILARILMMIPAGDISLKTWLFDHVFQPLFGDYNGSLAFAIVFLLVSYAVMLYLYRRRIFFRV